MAKNIIQDVIVKNKRSIREISIERGGRTVRNDMKKIDAGELGKKKIEPSLRPERQKKIKKRNTPKMIIWTVALLSMMFLLFSITSFFSTATVAIIPKAVRVSLDDTFIARKSALPGELQYEIMTLQRKMSKQLDATETQNSEIKASGKIIVYNNFSAAPQKLIINTRFESEKGLTYKIPQSIIVPGVKLVGGKKVPGSIETPIFADEAGDKFNMKVSDLKGDFKIPGFKNDKK
ncbi:MAG: seg, partial [Parcubacteria group bacterium]|nr:seg [Parcubacteria group bacterium]